jgi:hypothetical protein
MSMPAWLFDFSLAGFVSQVFSLFCMILETRWVDCSKLLFLVISDKMSTQLFSALECNQNTSFPSVLSWNNYVTPLPHYLSSQNANQCGKACFQVAGNSCYSQGKVLHVQNYFFQSK